MGYLVEKKNKEFFWYSFLLVVLIGLWVKREFWIKGLNVKMGSIFICKVMV